MCLISFKFDQSLNQQLRERDISIEHGIECISALFLWRNASRNCLFSLELGFLICSHHYAEYKPHDVQVLFYFFSWNIIIFWTNVDEFELLDFVGDQASFADAFADEKPTSDLNSHQRIQPGFLTIEHTTINIKSLLHSSPFQSNYRRRKSVSQSECIQKKWFILRCT